jgi:unsaturated chondroitin disaccharide hydrolase
VQSIPHSYPPTSVSRDIFVLGILCTCVLTLAFPRQKFSNGRLDSLVNNAIKVSLVHLAASVDEVRDSTIFPTYGTKQLKWQLKKSDDWTSGFYPGCLWYAYDLSNDTRFENWARQWTTSLEQEKTNLGTHDLGFKFMCSYGNGIRLVKGFLAYEQYRRVMLDAASTLAKRFDPKVGLLSSNWDRTPIGPSYPVIIDIMMNLELLFWASHNGGPAYYADFARTHAATTIRDFVRSDGGTYHIVRYDTVACTIINKGTMQGAGDETTWSRGHAWGMYGMVVAYRSTRDQRFLNTAVRLADYFLNHLESDHVSNWDFQSDIKCRDVSATAIVTSGLFEMVKYVENDSLRRYYQDQAEAMLASLCSPPYFTEGRDTNCLLDHSTQYLPLNSNVDVPAIFADYYFLEAIVRYRSQRFK